MIVDNVDSHRFSALMNDTLIREIRKKLKEPLMNLAEQMVESAIDEAVKELNIRATSYHDIKWRRDVVEFILTRNPEDVEQRT